MHFSALTVSDWMLHQTKRLMLPHYRPKLAIGRMVERTMPGAVLISPTNFFDNDLTFLPDILDGVYPTPLKESTGSRSPTSPRSARTP